MSATEAVAENFMIIGQPLNDQFPEQEEQNKEKNKNRKLPEASIIYSMKEERRLRSFLIRQRAPSSLNDHLDLALA